MPDYNLHGLSTRFFEQLIQALAVKMFGPNIVIFGDGPDGGREATFNGTVPYPTSAGGWSGYGMLQAKFLQKSQGPKEDGKWALAQLKAELKKFPRADAKAPNYYVFITNVVLSPVSGSGGKDKLYSYMKVQAKRLHLRGWDVWDYDKLRALLDNNRDVAITYAAGITAGDVLGQLSEMIGATTPTFRTTMSNFLQKELLSEQFARLEQAGGDSEEKMLLSRVFIDLPVANSRIYDTTDTTDSEGFIASIMSEASSRFDRKSNPSRTKSTGRYVLIGGPGQGKTTIGQYLCQLFRVALLKDDETMSAEAGKTLSDILVKSVEQGLALPSLRRFPVRLELKSYASALANQETSSVFTYIQRRIEVKTNRSISDAVLRQWFATYPWLVIFDGLDEVPASSNRDQVLTSISDFWVDLAECDADVFVVATSRPQGYSEDFSQLDYIHKYLTPLRPAIALKYGQLLTNTRFGDQPERAEKVNQRLERALAESATARLMQTPLQVTIMAALVEKLGQPPDQRWSLFREYYRTIYDREVERQIFAAEILRTKRADIDLIHYRLGVLLQVESERKGTTDARLSIGRFRALVQDKLIDEGYESESLSKLTRAILSAASERLVFIVGVEADQVGFEIRSLQEFMAAEGLMEGSDEVVKERLREIAPLDSWRQVFLFAVGKCFTERRHLREFIFTLCSEFDLEDSGSGHAILRVGSLLALDILEEGTAREQPKFERMLAAKALSLLETPVSRHHLRLAGLFVDHLKDEYFSALTQIIGQFKPDQRIGAFTCLLELSNRRVSWAQEMVEKWIEDAHILAPQYNAAMTAALPRGMLPLKEKLLANTAILSTKRYGIYSWWMSESKAVDSRTRKTDWFSVALDLLGNNPNVRTDMVDCPVRLTEKSVSIMRVGVTKFRDTRLSALAAIPDHNPEWEPWLVAARFANHPSKDTLAQVMSDLSQSWELAQKFFREVVLPWPLRVMLFHCTSSEMAQRLAERIAAGDCGDYVDWEAAEARWLKGVELSELACEVDGLPFDQSIGNFGLPPEAVVLISTGDSGSRNLATSDLHRIVMSIPQPSARSAAAAFVILSTSLLYRVQITEKTTRELVLEASRFSWTILSPQVIADFMQEADWEASLNILGCSQDSMFIDAVPEDKLDAILTSICRDPSQTGLIRLAARSAPRYGIGLPCELPNPISTGNFEDIAALLTLHLLSNKWGVTDLPNLAKQVLKSADVSESVDNLHAIERSSAPLENRIELLRSITSLANSEQGEFRSKCFERLKNIVALRQSNLQISKECKLAYLSEGA